MWPFDGPIHMVNTKYSEIKIQHEIYDKSLRGAAVQVTRDGRYNASLGNYRYKPSQTIYYLSVPMVLIQEHIKT